MKSNVTIGVWVYADPLQLKNTLTSLLKHTPEPYNLILLLDGVDISKSPGLEPFKDITILANEKANGAPFCFNQLITYDQSDVIVFIESGSIVTHSWLERLLKALEGGPQNGLSGPSTNRSWNEQRISNAPSGTASIALIESFAAKVAFQYNGIARVLEPLHSLADFCYVVKREVIATIGAADEDYGLGPCWEMDYNIRAARAGFKGIWSCDAYVHRPPAPAIRYRNETHFFSASKQRYQNKFCQLKLENKNQSYCKHCRGNDCEHFAPKTLINIQIPLNCIHKLDIKEQNSSLELIIGGIEKPVPKIANLKSRVEPEQCGLRSIDSMQKPLVSCIMPTYNRRQFVGQAIQYFLRQDYPNRELIIVDDGTEPIQDLVPQDARIRYFMENHRQTIGAKRNKACDLAKGEIIIHWDDDDWMADHRISYQVENLLKEKADISGLDRVLYFDPATGQSWQYIYPKTGRPWVAGNTLCYTKAFWQKNRFQEINVGEDSRFVWSNCSKRIVALNDETFYVAIIHQKNVSPKHPSGSRWCSFETKNIQKIINKDWIFYSELLGNNKDYHFISRQSDNLLKPSSNKLPLISCIMPTYNRRYFVIHSLNLFLQQNYPNKELIIIDDGKNPVEDIVKGIENVYYIRHTTRNSIGVKRNLACSIARGDIVAHWDDDDWYSSNRLSYQAEPIIKGDADITGLESSFIMCLPSCEFWKCSKQLHKRMFVGDVHGGTIMYRKRLWDEGICYPSSSLAEDAAFIKQSVKKGKRLVRLNNPGIFVYVRHEKVAWNFKPGQFLIPSEWQRVSTPEFFPIEQITAYQNIVFIKSNSSVE